MSRPVDLARYRRALALLDEAAALGARPLDGAELSTLYDGGKVSKKPRSIRVTDEQIAALEEIAVVLTERRHDLAALAGGELTPYTAMRVALHVGIETLQGELGIVPDRKEREVWRAALDEARSAGVPPGEILDLAKRARGER